MSPDAIPLLLGTVLALAALSYVLYPLLSPAEPLARSVSTPLAMAAEQTPGASSDVDPVEAAVRAAQARRPSCTACGPRPESDAIYCSSCGSYLAGACGNCGTAVALPGSRFCLGCGDKLAAS